MNISTEEQRAIHWDGIVAVCTGQYKTLTEAKMYLTNKLMLKKSGMTERVASVLAKDDNIVKLWTQMEEGNMWGDIWYTNTETELNLVKKELSEVYIALALGEPGRWRLGKKKYALEDRYMELLRDLGSAWAKHLKKEQKKKKKLFFR